MPPADLAVVPQGRMYEWLCVTALTYGATALTFRKGNSLVSLAPERALHRLASVHSNACARKRTSEALSTMDELSVQ